LRNVVNSDEALVQLRLPEMLMTYGPAGSDSEPTWSLLSTWKVPGQTTGAVPATVGGVPVDGEAAALVASTAADENMATATMTAAAGRGRFTTETPESWVVGAGPAGPPTAPYRGARAISTQNPRKIGPCRDDVY
jgi:hypothetical protein